MNAINNIILEFVLIFQGKIYQWIEAFAKDILQVKISFFLSLCVIHTTIICSFEGSFNLNSSSKRWPNLYIFETETSFWLLMKEALKRRYFPISENEVLVRSDGWSLTKWNCLKIVDISEKIFLNWVFKKCRLMPLIEIARKNQNEI